MSVVELRLDAVRAALDGVPVSEVAVRTEDQLRAGARYRQTIGVAQEMLMQRFGLTLDQSFELLRRYSQVHNIKLPAG